MTNGTTPAPAAPAAAPALTNPPTFKKFIFPFPQSGSTQDKPLEVPPGQYAKTWGQAVMDGFFPIGVNGQWHGGIHFDAGTATRFNQQDGVRCIADGEIIAWRLNGESMRSRYTRGTGRYSNGFVLVRHRLQYPDTQISGVFYSLYMHLAATKFYANHEVDGIPFVLNPLVCPNWWGKDPLERIAAGKDERPDWSIPESVKDKKERDAKRKEKGILLTKKGTKDPAAWLPNGQNLTLKPGTSDKRELDTVADKTLLYLRPAKLANGKTAPLTTAAVGVPPDLEIEEAKLTKAPARPQPTDKVNIVEPIPVKAGEIIGHLGYYERFADWDRAILHLETFAAPDFQEFINQCRAQDAQVPANTKHILVIEKDAKPVTGGSDSTITLPEGEWIRLAAGTPAGCPWIKVQRGINGNAAKDAEAKAKAAKANKPEPKPLPFVFKPTGAIAWIKRGALTNDLEKPTELKAELTAWENFPLQKDGPPGPPVFVQLVVNTKQKGPITDRVKDDQGARWWKVRYPTADAKGTVNMVEGWVSDASFPNVSLCTRWAWPGFELIVEPTPQPVKNLETRQCNNYGATSPVLTALLAAIDLNKDGKVTKEELWDAWQNPYLATYRLSRLIIEQDSEWGMPMTVWNEFGQALTKSADKFTKEIWEEDKKRIEKLLFWNEVKGQNGFPSGPRVWHMHPIGLIGNFTKGGRFFPGWKLGQTSEQYESGGKGPGTISTGNGDYGGVSYGTYQLMSRGEQSSTLAKFIRWSSYANQFEGLIINSDEFKDKWREIAENDQEGFGESQHEFIKETHYDPVMASLNNAGYDFYDNGPGVLDMVWSTSVQFGAPSAPKLISSALSGMSMQTATDADIIRAVQDYKIKKNDVLFASSSEGVRAGTLSRASSERDALLKLDAAY